MVNGSFRGQFVRIHEPFVEPIARRLTGSGLSPDALTLASVPPAVLAGGCAALGWFELAALCFTVSGVLDLLDGALARALDRRTRFGALLDSSLDRVADACVPIGLVIWFAPHGWVAAVPALALLASLWISYIRARAQSLHIELPRLWMRREDRFVALVVALLAARWVAPGAAIPGVLLLLVCGAIAVLGLVAGGMALARARGLADQSAPD
jgi:CDP-diacylglycerol--glycerol-3-phosphate 3-phosphatidyltransferase